MPSNSVKRRYMFISNHIQSAVHWWSAENSPDNDVRSLLPFLFENIDALYFSITQFPEKWSCESLMGIHNSGKYNRYFKMGLNPRDTVILRSAISLSGDVYCIVKRLSNIDSKSLQPAIDNLLTELDKYRKLRNFFAHFDDRITNLERHGITGAKTTECGINYTEQTVGCFHMAMTGNTFHFCSEGNAETIEVGKDNFIEIINAIEPIYLEIISHKLHGDTSQYPVFSDIFP